MDKIMLALAAFYGCSGVAIGAFAAHALKSRLDAYALDIMQTATQYQMIHAVALLAMVALSQATQWSMRGPFICMAIGIPLFSGSLYLIAISGIKTFGMITPLGGLLLIAGWVWLMAKAVG